MAIAAAAASGHTGSAVDSLIADRRAEAAREDTSAALMWPATRSAGLSLSDRICLAAAVGVPGGRVVTVDRPWTTVDVGVPVDLIR